MSELFRPLFGPAVAGGGGGGAPTNSSYVTMGLDGTLTNERVLTAGAGVSITDGGPNGPVTVAVIADYQPRLMKGYGSGLVPSNDLIFVNSSSSSRRAFAPRMRNSGKYYFAVRYNTLGSVGNLTMGMIQQDNIDTVTIGGTGAPSSTRASSWGLATSAGQYGKFHGAFTSYAITPVANDVVVCYVDITAGKIWWQINGTIPAAGDPVAGTNAAFTDLTGLWMMPAATAATTGADAIVEFDFTSASPFGASIASGYTAWG